MHCWAKNGASCSERMLSLKLSRCPATAPGVFSNQNICLKQLNASQLKGQRLWNILTSSCVFERRRRHVQRMATKMSERHRARIHSQLILIPAKQFHNLFRHIKVPPLSQKPECMDFLRKIIDSGALTGLEQPQPQWIFRLSATPIREARMYGIP